MLFLPDFLSKLFLSVMTCIILFSRNIAKVYCQTNCINQLKRQQYSGKTEEEKNSIYWKIFILDKNIKFYKMLKYQQPILSVCASRNKTFPYWHRMMVPLLDGNLEYVALSWGQLGLFEKIWFVTALDLLKKPCHYCNQDLEQIK